MRIAVPTLAAVLLAAATSYAVAQTPAAPTPAATPPAHDMSHMKPAAHHHATQRAGLTSKQIEAVQAALATNGQTVDKDGKMGPKTVAALREFQKSHGLKATGRLDKQTAEKLNLPQAI